MSVEASPLTRSAKESAWSHCKKKKKEKLLLPKSLNFHLYPCLVRQMHQILPLVSHSAETPFYLKNHSLICQWEQVKQLKVLPQFFCLPCLPEMPHSGRHQSIRRTRDAWGFREGNHPLSRSRFPHEAGNQKICFCLVIKNKSSSDVFFCVLQNIRQFF